MRILALFLVILFFTVHSPAATGLYVIEGLIGYSTKFTGTTNSVKEKTIGSSETSLGYILFDWLYLGGMFNYTAIQETTNDVGGTETAHSETLQYYGPSLGWMGDNWFVIGHYLPVAEYRDTVGSFTRDRTGGGFGLNVGYRFDVGPFELGPMLAYKNINYTNCKDPITGVTSSCNPNTTEMEFTPYVTLLFNFK